MKIELTDNIQERYEQAQAITQGILTNRIVRNDAVSSLDQK